MVRDGFDIIEDRNVLEQLRWYFALRALLVFSYLDIVLRSVLQNYQIKPTTTKSKFSQTFQILFHIFCYTIRSPILTFVSANSRSNFLSSLNRSVVEDDGNLGRSHVGRHESSQVVDALSTHAIERETHRLAVWEEPVADAAIGRRLRALPDQILIDPIFLVVGDHDEEVKLHAGGISLRDQHVLRPSASADVPFFLGHRSGCRATSIEVPERLLVRNGDGGLGGTSVDGVLTRPH